jgi:hypothetical protein
VNRDEVWDTPVPPDNVRVVFADNIEIEVPVVCTYAGVEATEQGIPIDVWIVELPDERLPVRLRADLLPAHSSIRFPVDSL